MEDTAKDFLTRLEDLKETYIALGLFAGWGLSSTFFFLQLWFRKSCRNQRLRMAGQVGLVALFGALNFLVIEWA
ncbi:MAG: hypothetical protein OYG32_08245 [Rhodospirillaceae bacterium]|nr:hypothetical protein [Rhodospirillaceae bacterium]MDE0254770.1 hypothetical protein [Rhodospirillaceae bacterium]MDE0616019.1 hypothetical protein [Rhodospirillaceae bacterium]